MSTIIMLCYPHGRPRYTKSMTYNVGDHVDLTYLNRDAKAVIEPVQKRQLYVPGTRILFRNFGLLLLPS